MSNRHATRRVLVAGLLLGVAGCAASAPARMTVEILDEWFVRVDGERLARDEFVYRMRQRGRDKRGPALPEVRVQCRQVAELRVVIRDLTTQLRLAGVKTIELGS
ncbi:MAG: hypothetical protein H6836_02755 [Planctomycetes bacterium]|nr:hypothetical protein [Planctomycetota bacterium]